MRALILLLPLIAACDDSSNNNNNDSGNRDLSTADHNPLAGCNSFDTCLTTCAKQNQNDEAGYAACADDCAALATDNAITLWVDAYFVCPGTKFCGPGKVNDAGVQPCSATDLDPTGATVSDACNECLNNAYRTMASAINTQCKTQIDACTADKP